MMIRDVIHGSIFIHSYELPIIDSKYFQRLRQIKQVGFSENSFPSATHNRFIHSLGAMEVATQVFDSIFRSQGHLSRFRALLRLAALLHDIGHGPLSHTTEIAMPSLKDLKLPSSVPLHRGKTAQATHEDYTLKMILDSGLTPILEKAGQAFGFKPIHIAGLIDTRVIIPDDFFLETLSSPLPDQLGQTNQMDFRPILTQMISSEIDADRMDYLRRDSLHAGVSYGQFDFSWLLASLTSHFQNGQCFLTLQHRALYAFEDFLLSRYHMFLMVYFHHKSVVYDEMLAQYFSSQDCDYTLPTDIEAYCDYNDAHLYAHLSKSGNEWAQRIVNRRPYQLLIELHSGIPATKTAKVEQEKLFEQVKCELAQDQMGYLTATSTGELSKYFRKPGIPIFVSYDNHYNAPSFIPLEQCTDLFQKYEQKRSITRIYVSPENYDRYKLKDRKSPLKYEPEIIEPVVSPKL